VGLEDLGPDVVPVAVGQVPAGVVAEAKEPLIAAAAPYLVPLLDAHRRRVQGRRARQRRDLHAGGDHRPEGDEVGVGAAVGLHVGCSAPKRRQASSAARVSTASTLSQAAWNWCFACPAALSVKRLPIASCVAREL